MGAPEAAEGQDEMNFNVMNQRDVPMWHVTYVSRTLLQNTQGCLVVIVAQFQSPEAVVRYQLIQDMQM